MSVLAGLLIAGGSAIASGYLKDSESKKQAKESNAELQRTASSLREQAGIYGSLASSQLKAAKAYTEQAKASLSLGQYNAKSYRIAAANLDPFEQLSLSETRKEARARVGEGRATFAANGVLVDSGSAARWEQDEAADAALEQLDIMQQYENQSWEYRTQANISLAEGYANAASYYGSAASAAGEAYASRLQQASALSQASTISSTRIKSSGYSNTLGAVLGFGSSFGMSMFEQSGGFSSLFGGSSSDSGKK